MANLRATIPVPAHSHPATTVLPKTVNPLTESTGARSPKELQARIKEQGTRTVVLAMVQHYLIRTGEAYDLDLSQLIEAWGKYHFEHLMFNFKACLWFFTRLLRGFHSAGFTSEKSTPVDATSRVNKGNKTISEQMMAIISGVIW